MKKFIKGLTESTLTLNTLNIILHGTERAGIEVNTDNQERELHELLSSKLIAFVDSMEAPVESNNLPDALVAKRKRGRPKGSKGKASNGDDNSKSTPEAQDIPNKRGSKVIVATPEGPRARKMVDSIVPNILESDATAASLEAMDRIEREEAGEEVEDYPVIDESKLDPSERMGNKAIISAGSKSIQVDLTNSILPDRDAFKNRDAFIDRTDTDGTTPEAKPSKTSKTSKTVKTVKRAVVDSGDPDILEI